MAIAESESGEVKPYFEWDGGVLYCGDCLDVLPTLTSIDAVITDPPYGISHSSSHRASWMDVIIQGDSSVEARDVVLHWAEQCRENGGIPWVAFGSYKAPVPVSVRGTLVWDKGPAFGMGDLSFPWKQSWEHIYVGGEGWEGKRTEGVLRGPVVVSWESKGRKHPHEKPVWLMRHFIDKLPNAKTILDPFAGSGTTAIACLRTGRRFVGMEIEEKYCAIAKRRIEDEIAGQTLYRLAESKE